MPVIRAVIQGLTRLAFSVFSWIFLAFFPALVVGYINRRGKPRWPFYVTSLLSFMYVTSLDLFGLDSC